LNTTFIQTISLYPLLFSIFFLNARGSFRVKVLFVFHLAHEQKLGNQRFSNDLHQEFVMPHLKKGPSNYNFSEKIVCQNNM